MDNILIDTSALLAMYWDKDQNHAQAATLVKNLKGVSFLLPMPIISEFFYIANSRIKNYLYVVRALNQIHAGYDLVELKPEDMQRMEQIMLKYADAEFDYADAALMALSERLKITRVFTFDRRDFSMFIPAHVAHLELLP